MFRSDLVDLINGHRCWAFVGSGVSTAAGYPNWDAMIEAILAAASEPAATKARTDPEFKSSLKSVRYPEALDRLKSLVGKQLVDRVVRQLYGASRLPSDIARILADWPFAGYITTNYDDSLRQALQTTRERGWVAVGNSRDETRKLAGGAGKVVWHIHGHAAMDETRSRLIVTEEDYDEIYLEGSPVLEQLKSIVLRDRMLFIGFGFRDYELLRFLKVISRLANPARPLLAFVPANDPDGRAMDLRHLFDKYSVDAIGYRMIGNSHGQLVELMHAHGSMILRRSLTFGQPERQAPSYDPETTGLLVYNELVLRQPVVSSMVHNMLMKVRLLSVLSDGASHRINELSDELEARAHLLGAVGDYRPGGELVREIAKSLAIEDLAILRDTDEIQISASGTDLVTKQHAAAQLAGSEFRASIEHRADEALGALGTQAGIRVRDAAEAFFKACIDRRALGLAIEQAHRRPDLRAFHMVALLRELPHFMAQLRDDQEALALTEVVQGILGEPTSSESRYIGLALQARFGVHLLGYDPDALQARWGDINETVFVVDSSSIIPFLAIGSPGYRAARRLITRLVDLGCIVTTTLWLTDEVAEHATYALRQVDPKTGAINDDTYRAAIGRGGERPNAFIDGFVKELESAHQSYSFRDYIERCIGKLARQGICTIQDVQMRLQQEGIEYREFSQWPGYLPHHIPERDELASAIQRARGVTYRKPRQVTAEAEAALIVRFVRDGTFQLQDRRVDHAHFVSSSLAVDEATGEPVVMKPDAVLQWVNTMSACSMEELAALADGLQWELAERGLEIVPRDRLRVAFEPLITADRGQLNEVLLKNRELIEMRFGREGFEQLRATSDIDIPLVLTRAFAEALESVKAELQAERESRIATEKAATISSAQKSELAVLQAQRKAKRLKDKRRQKRDRSRRGRAR